MKYSIVQFQNMFSSIDFRLDAEFYHPKYLQEEHLINKHKNVILGDVAFVTDGQHGYHEVDNSSNISHITAKNTKNWFVDNIDADKIAKWVDDNNKRSSLKTNDILLSTRGSVGYCALVKENILPANIDQDVARIVLNDQSTLISEYLLCYLNSRFGNDWLIRNSSGMVQQGLSLIKVRMIPIPLLNYKFQKNIQNLIAKTFNTIELSKSLYIQSEGLLLKELGLLDWQPKHNLWSVKNFSETQESERLDAEYYQPKFDDIIDKIKTYKGGYGKLSTLCPLIGHPSNPPYANEEEKDKTFIITQKHLGDLFPNENFWEDKEALYTTEEFIKNNSKYLLQNDDILLYSVGAYIGKTNIYNSNTKATLASFLTLIRPDKSKINPYYLLVYLNSIIGKEYTRRFQRGMAQQYIYPFDIKTFLIPNLEKEIQAQIELKIRESNKLRTQSKQLLEIAKLGVEKAIEENEEIATNWINQELEKLNIKLD